MIEGLIGSIVNAAAGKVIQRCVLVAVVLAVVGTGSAVSMYANSQYSETREQVDILATRLQQVDLRLDELERDILVINEVEQRHDELVLRVDAVEGVAENTDERLTRIVEEVLPCCVGK